MQNHALGAYAIASFVNGYKTINSELPNLIHIFIFLPMVMNEKIRNSIKAPKGTGGVKGIETFISNKVYDRHNEFGTLHNNINYYKEYTLTSLIFGLRTKLLFLSENASVSVIEPFVEYPKKNHIFLTANKLGELFASDKKSLEKLILSTGVNL